ncbi:MAG: ABC transporter ATP-binding protein [Limosilactobacillus gorillae]|uniref:ABC transporter ATP-binding protein n=1 Tax=Limosilactobacillus gorillae TaxID=1450649 RepID=UPI000AE9B5F3|nr:ABC transporter ATP-binding protein [Limosilactobacillus gorillae]MDO4855547.1 ABC transporter ATP-binding protein [Limosilactobacillus gorillae]
MIEFKNVSKIYQVGDQEVVALNQANFKLEKGKLTIILGPSGSGKSTLLNILGGMDRPTNGEINFDGQAVANLSDRGLTDYRRTKVGFIFQFYNLIPSLTAVENVAIAAKLTNNDARSVEYLKQVGLGHRLNNFPNQMSGGEMQRVSIARALAKQPELLLADEPTGALDSKTSLKIMELLQQAANDQDTAVVMVTHNPTFEQYGDQIIRLKDGQIDQIYANDDRVTLGEA